MCPVCSANTSENDLAHSFIGGLKIFSFSNILQELLPMLAKLSFPNVHPVHVCLYTLYEIFIFQETMRVRL